MDNFYIITNHIKDPSLEQTRKVQGCLQAQHRRCYIQDSANASPGSGYRYTDPARIPKDVDCVLVLGGDGTLLQAARDLNGTGLPLLGINLGTLGYLAEVEITGVNAALERLVLNEVTVEKRMMLSGRIIRGGREVMRDIALNDIVLTRRGRLRVVDFNIFVDGAFLCSYRADGTILSTPTGSTGYSLSAGGPIVSPDASLILMTGIAPHTLTSRPVVLPDHVEVTVEIGEHSSPGDHDGADVTFDGDSTFEIDPGDRICVTKSEKVTSLIKVNHTSFVEILRKKLN